MLSSQQIKPTRWGGAQCKNKNKKNKKEILGEGANVKNPNNFKICSVVLDIFQVRVGAVLGSALGATQSS